jgi:hypothetical protein
MFFVFLDESGYLHIPRFFQKNIKHRPCRKGEKRKRRRIRRDIADMSRVFRFSVLRRLCEYFLASRASELWWSLGLGVFFFGPISLKCLFFGHVFSDPYIAGFLADFYAQLTNNPAAYCAEAHQLASFFWMVVMFAYSSRCRLDWWQIATLVICIAINLLNLVLPEGTGLGVCTMRGTLFAVGVGSICGIMNVLSYLAICQPLILATLERIAYYNKRPTTEKCV